LLVTRASATQGRPEDHGKGRGLNRQHNDLVKFHKRSDPHLVTVIQELERMAQAALQTVPARRRSRLTQVIEACPQTAQCLLRLLSFLDAVTIPMQLFIDGATQLDYEISMQIHESGLHRTNPHLSQLLDLIRDNEAFTQAIENLCDRNLMHRKDDFVKMFTKDQKLVCGCLGEHDFVIQFEIAVSLICSLTRLDSTTAYDVSSHIQRLLTTWKSTSTYNHRDGSKRAIVFLFSRSGKAHFMKGQLLIACEHHQQAKDLYTKCLGSEHPSSLAAYQDLARALLKNQKYSQAEEAFTAIYNIVIEAKRRRYDPIVLGARRDLANFYYIRKQPGDLEKAQKHIEAVIQLTKGLRRPDERNLADLKRSKDLFYNIQHERAQNTPVEDNRIHRSYKRTY
jgi:tetratricopeptide (TPR) repeat protein